MSPARTTGHGVMLGAGTAGLTTAHETGARFGPVWSRWLPPIAGGPAAT